MRFPIPSREPTPSEYADLFVVVADGFGCVGVDAPTPEDEAQFGSSLAQDWLAGLLSEQFLRIGQNFRL